MKVRYWISYGYIQKKEIDGFLLCIRDLYLKIYFWYVRLFVDYSLTQYIP